MILAQAPAAGGVPPPSSVPPSASTAASTPPVFNFTPFNSTTAQGTSPSTVTIPQMPFGSFPMVLPPFGEFLSQRRLSIISIHSAFPPPPLPPVNFTGMSEEAIRAMEGAELAHVQARIQCLRNVRTLLDASMIQMQQYMNIVSTQRFLH